MKQNEEDCDVHDFINIVNNIKRIMKEEQLSDKIGQQN
jgi:hypothetical protein